MPCGRVRSGAAVHQRSTQIGLSIYTTGAAVTVEAGQEMLAEVLSRARSAVLELSAKWMFRYLLDLKEPGTAAPHWVERSMTIAHNFRQKAETAHDLVAECLDFPEGSGRNWK
jgi:hypothetical protein